MKKGNRSKTRQTKGHGEKLSRKAEDAIDALCTEPTIVAAAQKCGLAEKTLRRWLQIPDFRASYEDEKQHRLDVVTRPLEDAVGDAIYTLVSAMHSLKERDQTAAAKVVLDAFFKRARLSGPGRRPDRPEQTVHAPEEGRPVNNADRSPDSMLEQETADAPQRMPLGAAAGHTPVVRKKSMPASRPRPRAHVASDEDRAQGRMVPERQQSAGNREHGVRDGS